MKLEIIKELGVHPVSTHGGYGCSVIWSLTLNNIEILRVFDRIPWEWREKELEPPHNITELKKNLELALSESS